MNLQTCDHDDVTGSTLRRLLGAEGLRDPYRIYEDLRRARARGEDIGRVVVDYDTSIEILGDRSLSSRRVEAVMAQLPADEVDDTAPLQQTLSAIVAFLDPPDHDRIRVLLRQAFLPSVVRRQRAVIEAAADRLIDRMIKSSDGGRSDLEASLTHPLPALVMANILGVPETDLEQFNRWATDIVLVVGSGRPSIELARHALQSVHEMRAYMQHLVAHRRRQPSADLLSGMLQASDAAWQAGEQGLSEDEIFANALFLMTAGHETATNLLDNGIVTLLRHPEQLALLRHDPSRYPAAVDEVLRYESPVQMTGRITRVDRQIPGRRLRAGDSVIVMLGAANRDPQIFVRPDVFDLTRPPTRNLAFSSGAHYCLGAHLAREEALVLWPRLFGRFDDLQLTDREIPWQHTLDFRGPTALHVAWSQYRDRP